MADKVLPQIARLDKRYKSLLAQRTNWEKHWQELADFMLPRKADITKQRTQGDKRTELIFDSTALHSVELLASSLHGMLTSPSTPWFSLQYRDTGLQSNDEANEWLETCSSQMYKALQRSNFQQEIHELYYDLVVFGTAAIFIEYSDEDETLRYSCRHIAEIAISENMNDKVDTVFRKFKMTARQMVQRFGEKVVPDRVRKEINGEPYAEHEIVHVVFPREDAKGGLAKDKPFASIYYHEDTKVMLSEGGFDSMPFCVPRMNKDSVSIWGRSPAMNALPDTKMLNKMSEVTIRAAQKQIDPPLMVPDDGFILPVRTTPGALNFYRTGTRDRLEPLQVGANNPLGLAMEEQRRNAIREAFYVDQLLSQQGPRMTATEVLQKNEERMRLLGPVLGRLQSELLQPLITRTFELLLNRKQLPPAPEILQGQDIDIEYVSPLAKAQKLTDLQSTMRGLEIMTQVGEMAPVADYIDTDGLVKYIAETTGMPAKILRSVEEVAEIREQQQQQAAMQAQQQEQMVEAQNMQSAAPMMKVLQQAEQAAQE
tara:strand:+ start:820 stop:2442 length:1623 start_codon:yes stop_codon:yes gene_type:complete